MKNSKEIIMRIKGEPITMREFKDFSIDVLVYCKSNGVVEDGEDDAILNFIHHVNDCLEELALDELTQDNFLSLQTVAVFVLGIKAGLFLLVDGETMAEFTNIWNDLLFTGTLGSTFKETYDNLSAELYGGHYTH